MRAIINIFEVIVAFYIAFWAFRFYTGRLNYTGDKEEERKRRVKKYGWLMIIGIGLCIAGGVVLLISTLGNSLR